MFMSSVCSMYSSVSSMFSPVDGMFSMYEIPVDASSTSSNGMLFYYGVSVGYRV